MQPENMKLRLLRLKSILSNFNEMEEVSRGFSEKRLRMSYMHDNRYIRYFPGYSGGISVRVFVLGSGTGNDPSTIFVLGSGTGNDPSTIFVLGSGTGNDPSTNSVLQVRFLFVVVVVYKFLLLPTTTGKVSRITNFPGGPQRATRQTGAICLKIAGNARGKS